MPRNNWISSSYQKNDDGFALVAVLGFLLLFALILLPFATSSRLRLLTSANQFNTSRLTWAAQAINTYRAAQSGRPWRAHASCQLGRSKITMMVQDHAGLIDLNSADERLLSLGLEALNVAKSDASSLAHAFLAFRSPGLSNDHRDGARLVSDHGLKHAPFEDVVELHDFPVLRSIPVESLNSVFTVHSRHARVSFSKASPRLQASLAKNELMQRDETVQNGSVLTLFTLIQTETSVGSDAAIFELGSNPALASRRPITTTYTLKNGSSSPATSCSSVLYPPLVAFLTEALS